MKRSFLQMFFTALQQVPVFIAELKHKERNEQSYHAKDCQAPNVLQSGYWTRTSQHPPTPLPPKKHLHESSRGS